MKRSDPPSLGPPSLSSLYLSRLLYMHVLPLHSHVVPLISLLHPSKTPRRPRLVDIE